MSKTALKKKKNKKKSPPRLPRDNYKKEFQRELLRLLKAFHLLDCWQRLPAQTQHQLLNAYIIRPWRHRRDAESGIDKKVLTAWKKDIDDILDVSYIALQNYNSEILFRDFLTAGVSLAGTLGKYIDQNNKDYATWEALRLVLKDLMVQKENNPLRLMGVQNRNFTFICTSIDSFFYYENMEFHHPSSLEPYTCIVYTLTRCPAQKTYVTLEGKRRPVFRVGIPRRAGIDWAFASASTLGLDDSGEPLPVYVQSHCLKRLQERLVPLKRAKVQVLLYEAFENPEFCISPDGSRFATVKYEGKKVGYLLYQIIEGMVVLRTFLFLTQNGTHEGNALKKKYNLSKYSKTYFELDRLYTFSNTDIYKDRELEKIFAECGCGDLFHVWDEQEKDQMTFDTNYARNLKKIFIQDQSF